MKMDFYYTIVRGMSVHSEKLDGTKSAQVYNIENNKPKLVCNVHMNLTDNSENHIKKFISDKLKVDDFNLTLL